MTTDTGVTGTTTIEEAKKILRPQLEKGFICPCCNAPAKMYKRPITSAMAYGLILLYKAEGVNPMAWIHIEDYFKKLDIPSSIRADIPKLRFWKLIRPQGESREDENPNNGIYGLTLKGMHFVEQKIKVPSHIWLYNNKAFGYPADSKEIDIIQALKNKFSYKELMS